MLLEHGADPNIVNSEGRTPLVAAVHKGQAGSVAALACHKKTNLCAQVLILHVSWPSLCVYITM